MLQAFSLPVNLQAFYFFFLLSVTRECGKPPSLGETYETSTAGCGFYDDDAVN